MPALTSVRVQSRELGYHAGRLLLQRLNRQPAPDGMPKVTDPGFQIIERESA